MNRRRPGAAWIPDGQRPVRCDHGGTSLPIAIGLLLMMYPVLAQVRYEELGRLRAERGLFVSSLILNWVVGPALMFALAWLLLPDQPAYRTGLIIVGLARCIAMVLIWNDLADGDREAAAILVALNSLFQIVAYSLLGYFYLTVLPGWLGLDSQGFDIGWADRDHADLPRHPPRSPATSPRTPRERAHGQDWYEQRFLPRIGPIALYGLLFTIVMLFACKGRQDHLAAASTSPASPAAARLLRGHVRRVRGRPTAAPRLRAHHDAGVHRGQQQLRARDRRRDRRVRRQPARRSPASSGR